MVLLKVLGYGFGLCCQLQSCLEFLFRKGRGGLSEFCFGLCNVGIHLLGRFYQFLGSIDLGLGLFTVLGGLLGLLLQLLGELKGL